MKKILLYTLTLFLLASCAKEAGLNYSDKDRVYFAYNYKFLNQIREFDKTIFSFGMAEEDVKEDTVSIAVKLLGQPADHDRFYKISVLADSTTAIEGVHYKSISSTQKFKANLFVDTLKIVVLREALSSSHITQEKKIISLYIEESEDLGIGVNKGARTKVEINNYLSEPKWWKSYEGIGLYYYHPEKWKVLMRFNEAFKVVDSDRPMSQNLTAPYFSALRSYLMANPTYDKETKERVLIDRLAP
ncbi:MULTISPECIES: DUF4843 domain-containing protein [Sphingobacterium]|uniref:DUF4843 domain-containing protein n=1 Tax=Sphingobacterium TaxID=28453 RepID=UPI0013D97686|nr:MULTISPECIES: DUF4843 domain-containing protein [unclassified Sphingobacterium]